MPDRPPARPSVVTPGNHDGVHLGHRALVEAAREQASEQGLSTMAMCFDPHPTRVIAPERAPVLLTDMPRRVELLLGAGCDEVRVLPFDAAFAKTSPRAFVERVLIEACHAKGVVVGPDFHFGHRRSGNIDTLRSLGQEYGFTVSVVEPVMLDGEAVSSTRIRRALSEHGDVEQVARMLTRVHEVTAPVIEGDKRGRTIGFPTANLASTELQLPKDGVYAVVARRLGGASDTLMRGVANLGVRPTFEAGRSVEIHMLDFDGDLYDAVVRVGFVARLRGEQAFDGVDALVAQIKNDCDAATKALDVVDEKLLRWI